MVMDARHLASDNGLSAQVCIIGSGMGGTAVARALVDAGMDVLVLEAGAPEPAGNANVAADLVGRPFGLFASRAIELGGGSNLWHGICAPLDDIDFAARPWIAHSGWPIALSDLEPHYRAAWTALSGGVPSVNVEEVAERLRTIPHDERLLQTKIFQFLNQTPRLRSRLEQWAAKGKLRLVTHAAALELIADETGRVRHVVVGTDTGTFRVSAEVFVVAAGTLESPRLLLNSRGRGDSGLGQGADWTGRCLMDHPAAHLCQVAYRRPVPTPLAGGLKGHPGLNVFSALVLRPDAQRRHHLPNHYVFVRPGYGTRRVPNALLMSFLGVRRARELTLRQVLALAADPYVQRRVLHQKFGIGGHSLRYGELFFMTEQIPDRNSRVSLSDRRRDRFGYPVAQVDWRLSQADRDAFGRYLSLLVDSMVDRPEVASIRRDSLDEWMSSACSAAHHLGTNRMAASPNQGVVDANLKVFGATNLYVCDGSVFPTAGSVNPSLTIFALGLRLGRHIALGRTPAAMPATVDA